MIRIGALLAILGFGSLLYFEVFGTELRIMEWAEDMQPGLGLGMGLVGLALIGAGLWREKTKEKPTEQEYGGFNNGTPSQSPQGQAPYAAPQGGPQAGAQPPAGPGFGQPGSQPQQPQPQNPGQQAPNPGQQAPYGQPGQQAYPGQPQGDGPIQGPGFGERR